MSTQQHNGTTTDEARQRAEQLLDEWGQQAGRYAAVATVGLLKRVSLAREAVEDIWAEAQAVRDERRSADR